MATYNGEKYIKEQIDSIINQSYKNWELLIRDDGSNDKTVEIIKEYIQHDNRIKLIEDELGNLGYNKNFETLISLTDADYIMISDQDDIWYPNKIEISLEKMLEIENEKRDTAILVHSNAELFNKNNLIKEKYLIKNEEAKNKDLRFYFFQNCVQGASCLINKNLKNIILPFIPEIIYDYYILLCAEMFGERYFIDSALMKYRIHENNIIGVKNTVGNKKFKIIKEKYVKAKYYYDDFCRKISLKKIYKKNHEMLNKKSKNIIENFFDLLEEKNKIKKIIKYIKNKFEIKENLVEIFFLIILTLKKNRR
jgi:rhamnosyltransferase